jgi:transcriptional regulator with XRE-family HTH domain
MSQIIKSLRRIRKKKKMTLLCAAQLAGVSMPYLSEVERGRSNPSLAVVERILAAYGKKLAVVPQAVEEGVFSKLKILLEHCSA